MTSEDFITYCFDREINRKKQWYWDDFDLFSPEADELALLMTNVFRQSYTIRKTYTSDQIAQGFDFLLGIGSDYFNDFRDLHNTNFDLHSKVFESFKFVISEIFNTLCEPVLSHGSKFSGAYINAICFMLWDNDCFSSPIYFKEEKALHPSILNLLKYQLRSSNIAVQESAIHGYGHISYYYPDIVKKDLGVYIKQAKDDVLIEYAKLAINGRIQ